jgi:hercynylcysteine S-oxide lyase
VPGGCAILYVPFRNQHLIRTSLPTSFGSRPLGAPQTKSRASKAQASEDRFGDIFARVATADVSPYLYVVEALRFRERMCGGEERIRKYCFALAQEGALSMQAILGTAAMNKSTKEFADTETDGRHKDSLLYRDGPAMAGWITKSLVTDFNT